MVKVHEHDETKSSISAEPNIWTSMDAKAAAREAVHVIYAHTSLFAHAYK